jgi:hypothetical protein
MHHSRAFGALRTPFSSEAMPEGLYTPYNTQFFKRKAQATPTNIKYESLYPTFRTSS